MRQHLREGDNVESNPTSGRLVGSYRQRKSVGQKGKRETDGDKQLGVGSSENGWLAPTPVEERWTETTERHLGDEQVT